MSQAPAIAEVLADPGWHLYQLDFAHDTCDWLPVTESQFREASFLDQRIHDAAASPVSFARADVFNALAGQAPASTDFIFHIGHCGSTLLSRALAATPAVLPIREPLTLRQLSSHASPTLPQQWQEWLQLALSAHNRPFHPGQRCMIKATSTCNALIRPVAEKMPDARMLLVFVRLEPFLAGMLGKESPARDLAGHAPHRLQEWQALTGEVFIPPATGMGEVQLAVLTWLTSVARMMAAVIDHADQCLMLDFDAFLEAPERQFEILFEHFGLQDSRSHILQAWPEISLGYSKQPDQPYSAFNRNRTLSRGRMLRGAEIQQGLDWARHLVQQHRVFHECSLLI